MLQIHMFIIYMYTCIHVYLKLVTTVGQIDRICVNRECGKLQYFIQGMDFLNKEDVQISI